MAQSHRTKLTVLLTPEAEADPYTDETLWGRFVAGDEYEIENVPMLAYNISLGDVVRVSRDDRGRLVVIGVSRRSGNETLRLLGADTLSDGELTSIIAEARTRGAVVERWEGKRLVALSFSSWKVTDEFVTWLAQTEYDSRVSFEAGFRKGLPFWGEPAV
jgi:hypothetical protein